MQPLIRALLVSSLLTVACSDSGGDGADPQPDGGTPMATPEPSATPEASDEPMRYEAPPIPALDPIAAPPEGSLLPDEVESCPVIRETRCVEDKLQRCAIWDATSDGWAQNVPRSTEQAFVFDRYYDLYHQAEGLAADVFFHTPQLAGTPEEDWAAPEHFARYGGLGDASGWTGTALWGAAARYSQTGTPADYERMLTRLETMARLYDLLEAPGMLARGYWAMLEEGAPRETGHRNLSLMDTHPADGSDWHYHYPIGGERLEALPDYFRDGVSIDGTAYAAQARVQGDTSRDHYARSMPGVLLGLDLLGAGTREDAVRAQLSTAIPCTLRRMKKGRIRNLQDNPMIVETLATLLGGPSFKLDPGDLEVADLDELTFFVLEQGHPEHMELFDAACPDTLPTEITDELNYDASDPLFLLQIGEMLARETRSSNRPIAFSMHVSVRAADLLMISQWALVAHYLTGEMRYLEFLAELLTEVPFEAVLDTWAAFSLPRFCASHFGPSLGYPTAYNLLARIDGERYPEFRRILAEMAVEELRRKENEPRADAFFGLLYHRMVTTTEDPSRDAYVARMARLLGTYGMNPDDPLEPDRNYPRNWIDTPSPDAVLETIAPGDEAWEICESPIEVFGIMADPPGIDGEPTRSVDPLPLHMRIGGAFLWAMDPWMVKREYGGTGMDEQWPMLGMTTAFWVGLADRALTEGGGYALGWQPSEDACPTPP